jgi:hypothetical protein
MNVSVLVTFIAAIIAPSLGVAGFATSFLTPSTSIFSQIRCSTPLLLSGGNDSESSGVVSVDVSDLGLTMADLEKKIPIHNFSFESSGYQSTSRVPNVNDDGCYWVENADDLDVTLRIPGLRGQPAEALSVLFSSTTTSITAFGRIVWSAIQMGISDTDDCTFLTVEGNDAVPIVQLNIRKRDVDERWGGFILQVGEDSIL